ncbi:MULTISPECIES: hypothetical protein [Streptomyces]|uniref:DUF676 domain-containing protein n=1 Tax=Streptomyces luteosporeus TaxID=173856 RepID=A0ABN3TTD8_9ACTN
MTEQNQSALQPWNMLGPQPRLGIVSAPDPDAQWDLSGGTAWVFYGKGHRGLKRPVILSDGFATGPSNLNESWDHLDRAGFAFATTLRERGHDLIFLGYDERSASILSNAEVAEECIKRAVRERSGDVPLTVGGFSMGGLVTRYALAKMESRGERHETGLYVSFDSPHRGAWVPIALQGLAHLLHPAFPGLSDQINSPASRQLLFQHIETVDGEHRQDPLRKQFLDALREVGWWPSAPRLIGVASGSGNGVGNGAKAGIDAIKVTSGPLHETTLRTQTLGPRQEVARLKVQDTDVRVVTDNLAELDGAPGGMLESFGIAGRQLRLIGGVDIEPSSESICFVPSVSAVDIRDLDRQEDVYADVNAINPEESGLDEFKVSAGNDAHAYVSEELAHWILERLPR